MGRQLVGRVREMRELRAAVEDVAAGCGALFLLAGEPGIGKTRLADALCAEARSRGFRVAWGRAWEAGGAPALAPWIELFHALGRQLPGVPTRSPLEPEAARRQQQDAVVGLLEEITRDGPVAAVLDDLHAADASSLGLLHHVARRIGSLPLLLLGTYRDGEARLSAAAGETLARITREGTFLPLRRLPPDEVAELAASLLRPLTRDEAAALHGVTEGNPLFVEQVVRLWRTRDAALDPVPLPDSVRAAIAERLRPIPATTRELLEVAAVLGRETSTATLSAALALPRGELRSALQPALLAGVLTEPDGDRLRFDHVLLQEALYDALPLARRAALHARAAAALERLGVAVADDPHLAERAHHELCAVPVVPPERAIRTSLLAAARAVGLLAFEDAHDLLERALAAHPGEGGELGLRAELLAALGRARMLAGARDEGKHACRLAAALAREAGDVRLLSDAALALGSDFSLGVVDAELVAMLEECLAFSPPPADGVRARLMARLAAARQPAPDPEGPVALAREAIALARGTGDEETLRGVLHWAASAFAAFVAPEERVAVHHEQLQLSARAGDRAPMLRAHARLAMDLAEMGEFGRADASVEACAALATEVGGRKERTLALLLRASRALFRGSLEEVARLHDEAHTTGGVERDPNLRVALAYQQFAVHLELGEHARIEALEPRLHEAFSGSRVGRAIVQSCLSRARARRGERPEVEPEVAALEAARLPAPYWALMVAEQVAAAGTRERKEQLLALLLPHANRFATLGLAFLVVEAPISRLCGLLCLGLGRRSEAEAHLVDALLRLEEAGAASLAAQVRRELSAIGASTTVRGAAPTAPAAETRPPRWFELRREGEYWTLASGAGQHRLRDSAGLRILEQLVASPDAEVHVLTLAGGPLADAGDAGPALDAVATRAYRARIEDLRETLREAEAFGDAHRAARAREELDLLADELARGVGLGGRARVVGSAHERARINVQRHLKRAIARIAEVQPELGRYLEATVKTGSTCSFRPTREWRLKPA